LTPPEPRLNLLGSAIHSKKQTMRIAVPDLVSNSYFPVIAAAYLGVFKQEGADISLELVSPLSDCIKALRDGDVDFVGASAHAPLLAFPEWEGVKLLCAQSQGTYWFLVTRKDLGIARGDLAALKGKRIAAVPFVGAALVRMLAAAGIDAQHENIQVMMPESAKAPGVNFGVAAARALKEGAIDGFFANGMGAEIAVEKGLGSITLDVRRDPGPKEWVNYTMPAVATTDRLLADNPEAAAAVIRGIIRVHAILKNDISLATKVGNSLFPPDEAELIARVVKRDLPFYDHRISEASINSINEYSRGVGLLKNALPFQKIVATEVIGNWDYLPG
jgi:NitT/TauT family transport system substrate-binding protein